MTIYNIMNFNPDRIKDYVHQCAKECSLEMALSEAALREAYRIHCGGSLREYCKYDYGPTRYCKKTWCWWPLTEEQFSNKYWRESLKGQYADYNEYKNSDEFRVVYEVGDDDGMCHLYSLLDNFNNYIGAFKWEEYLVILSVGSSYTGYPEDYNLSRLSEGFSVAINTSTNSITLIALGEDDGNYWAEEVIPYSNLSIYDKGIISSIVNDIDESRLENKWELMSNILKT